MNFDQLIGIISLGTLLLLAAACFIPLIIYSYQNRLNKSLREKEELQNTFKHEILKAQIEMQEQTFLSISHEIHDNIGQILSLTKLNISAINFNDISTSEKKIEASKELISQAIDDLRDLSKRLNTDFASRQSLPELIRFHLGLIQKGGQHQTSFNKLGKEYLFNSEVKLILIRVIQEALNNIIKHAEATTITIILEYFPEKAIITIKDNGKGFEISQPREGIGIQNIIRRVNLINAKFSIQSSPNEGTLLQIEIPRTL